ncbi:MAG: hypothetical protein IT287_02005 [Bdellovibrionaceae bacterium]|nr:hypothetical protein [Pseudobdellovibrionaceae bacterium]
MKLLKLFLTLFISSTPIATAKTFESLARTTSALRLPASVVKEAIEIDCATTHDEVELSTQLETIRVVGKNCPQDISVMHLQFQQKLHAFPAADEGTMTSEYAYLRKGENHIQITAGKKSLRLKILRY